MTIACFIAKVMLDFYKFTMAGIRTRECYNAIRRGQNWLTLWRGKIDAAMHAHLARAKSRGEAMRGSDRGREGQFVYCDAVVIQLGHRV